MPFLSSGSYAADAASRSSAIFPFSEKEREDFEIE